METCLGLLDPHSAGPPSIPLHHQRRRPPRRGAAAGSPVSSRGSPLPPPPTLRRRHPRCFLYPRPHARLHAASYATPDIAAARTVSVS
jgi:hypothetical protein